jgi:hypothetical protein
MYTRLQMVLWSAAAVFGLAYSEGDAAPTTKSTATAPAKSTAPVQAKSTTGTNNYGQVISELHKAKHLLDHANHTYNGHRAKADHEITKAIHVLHPEHHKKGTTTQAKTKSTGQAKTTESQQASDTDLRQAEKLVHAAIHELKKHHHDHKTHEATKLLHEAAKEIELAIHAHHKHHAAAAKNQLVPAK